MTTTVAAMKPNNDNRTRTPYLSPAARVGSKYVSSRSTKEIAALYRAEVKAGIKTGSLPAGLKVSVRCESSSTSSAIRVHVTACPAFRILNPERVISDIEKPHTFVPEYHCPRLTTEAKSLIETLDRMLSAYRRDASDSMVDYFDVNFYGYAEFDYDLEKAERQEITEEYKANAGWTLPEEA